MKNILFVVTLMVITSISAYAQSIKTKSLFRFIDSNSEYGKICEKHEYITPLQRFELITNKDAMFGDIFRDSHSIADLDADTVVNKCNVENKEINAYTYKEQLDFINDNLISIKISQYEFGAEASLSNSNISYYMYDREYGMSLTWEDIFGSDKSLDLYILKRVIAELADEEFIYKYDNKYQLLNFRIPGYFTINENGLIIQYGKYEIAPATSGLPSITVSKDILKKFMAKDKYNKYFTQTLPTFYQVSSE
ncbi:putative lipoprotein [hydrothermal vent metagenome]|uniref:Putative lipoprotein n=1 Tax=hydrothermal vent metagenome TaxID=652676 RepID=A0A1W1EFN5_9ZZZZ